MIIIIHYGYYCRLQFVPLPVQLKFHPPIVFFLPWHFQCIS